MEDKKRDLANNDKFAALMNGSGINDISQINIIPNQSLNAAHG